MLVQDVLPGSESSSPSQHTVAGDSLYFVAYDTHIAAALWTTDGTPAGTRRLVRTEHRWPYRSQIAGLTAAGDAVYFTMADAPRGNELWRSGGTVATTAPVADLRPGPRGSFPGRLTLLGDALYFSADNGVLGRELWRLDLAP